MLAQQSLWVLLAIALVYAIFQHVILANVPEVVRGGARLGALAAHSGDKLASPCDMLVRAVDLGSLLQFPTRRWYKGNY
jgi:hypothetical protein